METTSYLIRLKPNLGDGVRTGAVYGFLASLAYNALTLVIWLAPLMSRSPDPNRNSAIQGALGLSAMTCAFTVIPSAFIGFVDGALVAAILSIWKKRISSTWAGVVGLTIGAIVIFTANYLLWRAFGNDTSFMRFLLPTHANPAVVYFSHPFLFPSIIAIMLSAIGTREINKRNFLEKEAG